MPKKKPYYPNNWEAIHSAPSEYFQELPFDQFMSWKMEGWELPSSVACIIREKNLTNGKVKEYVYQQETAARNKARQIMDIGESEFVVCTQDQIHVMEPKYLDDPPEFDDPLN